MNSELEGTVIPIDPKVLEFLRQQPDVSSIDRNKHLLQNGMVSYGQLKRILHDMKYMDKKAEPVRYNLYGGQPMEDWGKSMLKQLRDMVRNRKKGQKMANDMTVDRKNSFNKSKAKSMSPKLSLSGIIKPNSEKFSNASMFSAKSMKLTEEINKIKKLME